MTSKFKISIVATIAIFLASCLKEEKPVEKPDENENLIRVQIPIGFDRERQIYFKMETGKAVRETNVNDFDLLFDSQTDGFRIFLNDARFMAAARTGKFNFSEVTNLLNAQWRYDAASKNPDSTAIGDWLDIPSVNGTPTNEVILIHLGYDKSGNDLGYRKAQFIEVTANSYSIRYANLNGSNESTISITKDQNCNYSYLKMANGGVQVYPEPNKEDWDILFTQYTDFVLNNADNIYYPYSVNGVIQNKSTVKTALDTSKDIMDYTKSEALTLNYRTNANSIGYNWKKFINQSASGTYVILYENNYFVKINNSEIFVMRFIDFLDNTGTTGFPTFEYRKIE